MVVSTAIPPDNPELRGRHRARAASRRAAGPGVAAEAGDRDRGHSRQDDHLWDGRPRAGRVRPRPGLPDRGRAALGRHERRLGGGGVDRGRGRRVRPLLPGAGPRCRGGHQRRARPSPHVPLARRSWRRRSPSSPPAPGPRSPARDFRATSIYGIGEGDLRAEELELHALGARSGSRGWRWSSTVPGRHNVLNALAALAACREAGRADRPRPHRRSRASAGAGRRFEPRGTTPRARGCSTTTRITRRRSGPRWRPPARSTPAGWSHASSRISSPAPARLPGASARRWRSRTSWPCWTSTRRASGPRTSPGSAGSPSPGPRPTPVAGGGCSGPRRSRMRRSGSARRRGRATW